MWGGSKNQNKRSVFPAAYKLVHLYTNLIFKHSIQNLQNTTKSPFSNHPIQKSQYRTQYRQTQLKSTLSPITHPNQKPQFKPLSSYINTKIPTKSTLSPITHFSIKLPTNPHSNPHQIFYISHLKIIILHNSINTNTKHSLHGILRLNQRNQY